MYRRNDPDRFDNGEEVTSMELVEFDPEEGFPQEAFYMPEDKHTVVIEDEGEGLACAHCLTCNQRFVSEPKHAKVWADEHTNTQHYERVFMDRP